MNIDLRQKITFPDDEEIVKFLPLSETSFVTLTRSYNKQYYLNINNKSEKRIALKINSHNGLNRFCSLFRYKMGFGIAESFGKIRVWQTPFKRALTITIKSPYENDDYKRAFLSQVGYDLEEDLFFLSIEDVSSIGFPAKFWTSFKIHSNSILNLKFELQKQKLDNLNKLNVHDYPTTQVFDKDSDWLNILQLKMINNRTFIHTNGGFMTRTKSGVDFQFSILSEYNNLGELLKKLEIEEGKLSFAENNKYALLTSRKKPKHLLIYSIDEMKLIDSISLTALKFEERLNAIDFSFDIMENILFICGRKNLYMYELKH